MRHGTSAHTGLAFALALAASAASGLVLGPFFPVIPIVCVAIGATHDEWGLVYGGLAGALVGAGTCLSTFSLAGFANQ